MDDVHLSNMPSCSSQKAPHCTRSQDVHYHIVCSITRSRYQGEVKEALYSNICNSYSKTVLIILCQEILMSVPTPCMENLFFGDLFQMWNWMPTVTLSLRWLFPDVLHCSYVTDTGGSVRRWRNMSLFTQTRRRKVRRKLDWCNAVGGLFQTRSDDIFPGWAHSLPGNPIGGLIGHLLNWSCQEETFCHTM